MVLNECRQTIARCFSFLEKERLSDDGITAVCDMRKAVSELFEQASNYEDALLLVNRLTKSVSDDEHDSNVFANPFWDMQARKREESPRRDAFSEPISEAEVDSAPKQEVESEVEVESVSKQEVEDESEPEPEIEADSAEEPDVSLIVEETSPDEPALRRMSIRGSGRIVPVSKTDARDTMKDEVRADSNVSIEEPIYDAVYVEEVEAELVEDESDSPFTPSDDPFNNQFTGVTEEDLEEDEEDALFMDEDEANNEKEFLDFDEDDPELEEGVFEEDELPEDAVSYADDPYLLVDEFVDSLDDDEMELFIQMEQDAADGFEDVVRPGSLEKRGPKKEPKPTTKEAVEESRDKFYMPAKSRIAMIRGVEPEDSFSGLDLLASGYKDDEPVADYDTGVPTEDELKNAESVFFDEPEEEEPKAPSAIMEKVDAPDDEERDEADPSFDDDTLGISIDKSLLMDDDEYDHRYKVDMITTIAEQDAQAESYMDRMQKLANVSFSPEQKDNEEE